MKRLIMMAIVILSCFLLTAGMTATQPKSKVQSPPSQPTQADIFALVDKYTGWCEPKLTEQDKQAVDEVKKTLADGEFSDVFFKKALDDLVSQLTLKLTAAKSLDGLMVATGYLVKQSPKNRRVMNLFGSVLHTYDKDKDALTVFLYTLSLDSRQ